MKYKSNKHIRIEKDSLKSYVYIYEKNKGIGMLFWDVKQKRWIYENWSK